MKFENIENLKNLDTIILDKNQLEKLLLWRDNNKTQVRLFKPILQKGIIEVEQTKTYFEELKNLRIQYYVYINNEYIFQFQFSRVTNTVAEFFYNKKLPNVLKLFRNENEKREYIQDILTVHASSMAYMQYYKPQIKQITKEIDITKKDRERLKRQENSKSTDNRKVITIRTEKIKYIFPDVEQIKTKQLTKKQIKLDSWSVRGHIRQLKNGKVTFVNPYVKGKNKENLKGKIYKFDN
jgi:hypothetical protein